MFRFDDNLKVYLHRDPVDFRYGMNSLSILVEQAMHLNPMDSSLYIFGNRRRDRVKIIGWDGSVRHRKIPGRAQARPAPGRFQPAAARRCSASFFRRA